MATFNAGFHRGAGRKTLPRTAYEAQVEADAPWHAAEKFADTIPAAEKAQGHVVLHRPSDNAIFVYRCSTSTIPEHTITVPEKVIRKLVTD